MTALAGQSRRWSAIETLASTAIGYVVAVASQYVIFPLFGIHVPLADNLIIGLFFTIVSVIRGYAVRRAFNGISRKHHENQTISRRLRDIRPS